jgi:hypothetical protein
LICWRNHLLRADRAHLCGLAADQSWDGPSKTGLLLFGTAAITRLIAILLGG